MNAAFRKHARCLNLAIFGSLVSSLSLLAVLIDDLSGKYRPLYITFGILFWLGLLMEQGFFWRSCRYMKLIERGRRRRLRGRSGMFTIAATPKGAAADALLMFAVLAYLVCAVFGVGASNLRYLFLCLIVLAFRMHCILNGKSYRYKKLTERKADRKNGQTTKL